MFLQKRPCTACPGSILALFQTGQCLSSLLSDQSTHLLCSTDVPFMFNFNLDSPLRLQSDGYRTAERSRGKLMFLVSTLGSPCCSFITCSLCRNLDKLFFFDLVSKLLEYGVANGHAIHQLFSLFFGRKNLDPIPVSLRFLLDLRR